jgi:hypothetical protein
MSEKISQLPPFSGGSLPSTAKIPVSIDDVTYKASPSQFGGGGGSVGNLQEVTDNGNEVISSDGLSKVVFSSGSLEYYTRTTISSSWVKISEYTQSGLIFNFTDFFGTDIRCEFDAFVGFKIYNSIGDEIIITPTSVSKNGVEFATVNDIPTYVEDIRNTVKATQTINKGQAVYISGANGTNQLATKADYSAEISSSQTIGIAFQNFATNDIGQIITQGLLSGIDTSSASSAGDPIYLGANGNLIYGYANKPSAPNHLVYIGIVTRKHATNGEIYVKVQNGYEVEELHNMQNVSYSTPNDADSLMIKDNGTSLWKCLTFANLKMWLDTYLTASKIRGYLGITILSGSNTGDQDLSGLALKSMGAYSMRVNNTNATANATETNYQAMGKSAYSSSITWTGTTAPSGTTNHNYDWQRIGNIVFYSISLVYATQGTSLTAVQMAMPSDMPNPIKLDGLSSASNVLYEAVGKIGASESNVSTGAVEAVLRANSGNTGFEFYIASVAVNAKVVRISGHYFTA